MSHVPEDAALQVADVAEHWQTPDGPVEIVWTARGQRYRLAHRDGRDDFLHHLALLDLVNQTLSATPYRLVACDDCPGDCRFITALRPDEIQQLRQRGWSFCRDASPRVSA